MTSSFTEHSPLVACPSGAPAPPSGVIGAPVPCAEESAPTLAVGGSRLWRVLYLYSRKVRAAEQARSAEATARSGALSGDSARSTPAEGDARLEAQERSYSPGVDIKAQGGEYDLTCMEAPKGEEESRCWR